jgi:hypothetical protein
VVVEIDGRRLVGRLVYEPGDGIELRLLDPEANPSFVPDVGQRYPIIFGWLADGAPFTLLESFCRSAKWGMAGVLTKVLRVNRMLMGGRLQDPEVACVSAVDVQFDVLQDWVAHSDIAVALVPGVTEDLEAHSSISLAEACMFGFTPVKHGPSFEIVREANLSWRGSSMAAIASVPALRMVAKRRMSLNECLEQVFWAQSFLSLLVGHQGFVTEMVIVVASESEGSSAGECLRLHCLSAFALPPERPSHREAILPLPQVRPFLHGLWIAWHERSEQYRPAVELYCSTALWRGQLTNFAFLSLCQSLETLHRNRCGGTFVDMRDYEPTLKCLVEAIPSSVVGDLRQALKARLKYGNEYSLRRRLNGLRSGLGQPVARFFSDDLSAFLERVVNTRNFLTHYSEELRPKAFKGLQLHHASQVLRWFFLAVVLQDMGVPIPVLESVLAQSGDLAYSRERVGGGE